MDALKLYKPPMFLSNSNLGDLFHIRTHFRLHLVVARQVKDLNFADSCIESMHRLEKS